MENHPIPQQISSYQFRLVGDMTLKQFFQVGGGALIAILLYSSGLPVYIKWPLIIISFLLGVALAFFPLEDRPLSKWLVLFIKSVYAPTLYIWMANYQKPNYFQPEGTDPALAVQPPVILPETPVAAPGTPPALEQNEEQFLNKVEQLGNTSLPITTNPEPEVVVTSMVHPEESEQKEETEGRAPVTVPEQSTVTIQKQEEETPTLPIQQDTQISDVGSDVNPMAGSEVANAKAAQFSDAAAPPTPPTRENVIVGQVMDQGGKMVENAILEVKDRDGRAARALRSNKLGHFMIVTPLADGTYTIETEKDGLTFEPITIEASGTIIPPIAIRAK